MTSTEHFLNLKNLLKVEREEDRKQYFQKVVNRSISERRKDGVCWYPVSIDRSYLGIGEKWVIDITRQKGKGERHLFQAGSSASLFLDDEGSQKIATGIVSRVLEDRITIMLNREDPPGWIDENRIGLNLLFDESTYEEMDRTLDRLVENKDPRIEELIELFTGNKEPEFEELQHSKSLHLNESQNAAVNLVQAAKDVALIHGPPGTGKTTTMVQSIVGVLESEKQVLVCAPSNSAVDIIVEKLHELNVNVVRLGHPARVTESVVNHTLDVQLSQHPDSKMLKDIRKRSEELRRLGKQYKRKYGKKEMSQRKLLLRESNQLKSEALKLEDYMIYDVLNNASVIACTLVGANNQYLFKKKFRTVFLDESSQALEPASWIPILKSDRVILAGDHLQLSPTVKSKVAEKGGLGDTLFERCMNKYKAGTILTKQYRMQPEILSFSNEYFYGGVLSTAEYILNRKPLFAKSIEFIDTAGCGFDEKINPETLSTYNVEEAELVMKYLEGILNEKTFAFPIRVGVIAPYKAQVEKLRKQLGTLDLDRDQKKRIDINTVDAFQGQERDLIIMSLTRSNSSGEIGFLADERRMNVAMTRAKFKLVVFGDSATLSNHSFFDRLIGFWQDRGFYRSAFELIY